MKTEAQFTTAVYRVDQAVAEAFAQEFDPNPGHLSGHEMTFVSGLVVLALSNRAVLGLPEFQGIQLASEMAVRWIKPVMPGASLVTRGEYVSIPHPRRAETEIRKSRCKIFRESELEPCAEYEITQYLRTGGT